MASTNPVNHDEMRITDERARFMVVNEDVTVVWGKHAPYTRTGYARLPGSDTVYWVHGDLRFSVGRNLFEWRNKVMLAGGHGLANSSGLVGKYVMDTVGAGVYSHIPALQALPPHNEDGASGMHMYMPWWLYSDQLAGKLDFPRGYHIEFGGGRRMPGFGAFGGLEPLTGGSYGEDFKEDCRRYYGSFVGFDGRGEMIPNEDCYCEIDPGRVDRYGVPVLKFHWKWADHELNQALHMQRTFAGIVEEMGGKVLSTVQTEGARAIFQGGQIIHEVGGARMGDDPKGSVLNEYCQSWDVPNLFVTDGAPFVSNADKNPTLSIMALAWRASDYIVEQLARRSIG